LIIRKNLPASPDEIDILCHELSLALKKENIPEEDFACDILLREMLLNAIDHGCKRGSEGKIQCKISLDRTGLQISLKDSGPGFDWRQCFLRPYDPDSDSGRGLMIIKHYSTAVRYNASGNCVSVKRKFSSRCG